jgi:hypothetical protein
MTKQKSQNKRKWFALGAILLGAVYVVGGLWLLSWTSQKRSAALGSPTAARAGLPSPTAKAPTAVVDNPGASATTPAALSSSPDGLFRLTVVHSNDTWGYVRPCG